jgi:putative endonuclease
MVKCANDAFYTGWTTDPQRRIKTHNAGRGAAYTRMNAPVRLVYLETLDSRRAAMLRELEIKKYSHKKKTELSASWLAMQEIEEKAV